MTETQLTDREQLILQAVVHLYITSAEPVGSRAIVKKLGLDLSPATVRNVMADLEETGYLQQLHTSSGRVPTDIGYRYYVDYLMRIQDVTHAERNKLENRLTDFRDDADSILRQTSALLALISHQTSIVEAPRLNVAEVRHVEIIPIAERRLAFLLADSYGGVRTMVVPAEHTYSADEAQRLGHFLTDHLRGTPVDNLADSLQEKLERYVDETRTIANQAVDLLRTLPTPEGGNLFLEGTTQLFEQPEFQNVEKARSVFGLLEERDRIVELLRDGVVNPEPHPSRVVIGSEAKQQGFEDLSVVSAPYKVGDTTVGMVGVLGPRRMPYSKLAGLVEFTAGRLGNLLSRLAR
jgi:heat-inducible transcriptional repressor